MATTSIPAGVPTAIAQTTTFALPVSTVWLVSNSALDFSLDGTTWVTGVAASTTGMQSAWPFCRCTGVTTCVVSVRKH